MISARQRMVYTTYVMMENMDAIISIQDLPHTNTAITNQKSFYWRCIYKDNFKERITLKTVLNVMENFKPVVPIKQREPDIMLLGNLHPEIQLLAITQITNKPKAIILDTINYRIEKKVTIRLYSYQSRLILNLIPAL